MPPRREGPGWGVTAGGTLYLFRQSLVSVSRRGEQPMRFANLASVDHASILARQTGRTDVHAMSERAMLEVAEQAMLRPLMQMQVVRQAKVTWQPEVRILRELAERRLQRIYQAAVEMSQPPWTPCAIRGAIAAIDQGLTASPNVERVESTTRYLRFIWIRSAGAQGFFATAQDEGLMHWQLLIALLGKATLESRLVHPDGENDLRDVLRGGILRCAIAADGNVTDLTIVQNHMSVPLWNPTERGSIVFDEAEQGELLTALRASCTRDAADA